MIKYCMCGCGEIVKNKFISGHNLYKICNNRKGTQHSEETKIKMSKARMGRISGMKGKKHSIKTLIKMKASRKYISFETRKKMSESAKGKIFLEETKLKLKIAWKRRTPMTNKTKRKIRETLLKGYSSGRIKLHQKSSNTSIEIIMKKQLDKNNIKYEQQKYIPNVGLVDFFIPKFNIIIECDGDYWHNLSEQKIKDLNRDFASSFLYKYKTIRFAEHQIKNNIENCIKKIILISGKPPVTNYADKIFNVSINNGKSEVSND